MQDLLPVLHDAEFADVSEPVRNHYRELGAAIHDIAGGVPVGPAVDAWNVRVRQAIDQQRHEIDLRRLVTEREFYRSLLDLTKGASDEHALDQALALIVEVTTASAAHVELYDEGSDELRYRRGHGFTREILPIGDSITRGIIARAIADCCTVETPPATDDDPAGDLGSAQQQIPAVLCVPIGKPPLGVIYLQRKSTPGPFSPADRERLELFALQLTPLAERLGSQPAREDHTTDIRRRLKCEQIIGGSRAVAAMLKAISNVASLDVDVLLTGPSGTGKSTLARMLASNSRRSDAPFVELNCAAIPEQLLESELFGAERGAHSTATRRVMGKVAAADTGTLFLDEIGELSPGCQGKLLQLLQERRYYPLGSTTANRVNVRIVSATNTDLEQRVRARLFREDLFYRLHVMPIEVPSLDARREDIPELVQHFVVLNCQRHQLPSLAVSRRVLAACQNAPWPGNIRQLGHAIEAAVIRAHGERSTVVVERHVFPENVDGEPMSLQMQTRAFQRRVILDALERHSWNIRESARELGLSRSHLYDLIQTFNLKRDK
jgi:Nif-specific regulatory protein